MFRLEIKGHCPFVSVRRAIEKLTVANGRYRKLPRKHCARFRQKSLVFNDEIVVSGMLWFQQTYRSPVTMRQL